MWRSPLRLVLSVVLVLLAGAAPASAQDEEPGCNYCRTIDINGNFDGNGCATNFSMRPGSECYCLASLNGSNYGIDGYACRKPALPPEPPPPPIEWIIKKPNWERISDDLIKWWLERRPVKDECTTCYYTIGGIDRSCTTAAGSRGGACMCYEEMPGKVIPLRVSGKLCQAPDGSPR